MAQGLPVVAGKWSGGVPEIVQSSRTGILVDVRSSEALAKAMADLAQNPEVRMGMGAEGLRHARETFHMQSVMNRYLSLYDQIAKRPQANALDFRS
jgi:glycosyltransferase involved in cell wall biosynthesis